MKKIKNKKEKYCANSFNCFLFICNIFVFISVLFAE